MYFLMLCLKEFRLVGPLMLLGSLFQVLSPTYDKLCTPNFDLQKDNLNFLLKQRVATPLSLTGQKTVVRTLINEQETY